MQNCLCKFLTLSEIMRYYNVWQLARAIEFLQETVIAGEFNSSNLGPIRVPDERMNHWYVPMLRYCQTQCEQLELAAALARFHHFNQEIRQGITWSELRNQAKVLLEAIHSELCYRRFAFVPTEKATMHDKFGSSWEGIWARFPEVKEDSQRAADCYALEQNTACVFQMMRVAEIGLRNIAKQVGVRLTDKGKPQPTEYATWDKVIQGINAKITAARALAHGPKKNMKLQFYSQAADQCVFIRDIWRNEISHTRKSYNDAEALGVITRIREFMELLSKGIQ